MRVTVIIVSLVLSVLTLNYADAQDASSTNSTSTVAPKLTVYCPPINQLVRNPQTLIWEGKDPNLWEGYEMSFETSLDHFAGAQWHGTNVGQLFCVYHSARSVSFPVLILVHALVFEPSGGKWGKNVADYRNCVSTNQKDCAFTPQQPGKQENPYQELQDMKANPPSEELGY